MTYDQLVGDVINLAIEFVDNDNMHADKAVLAALETLLYEGEYFEAFATEHRLMDDAVESLINSVFNGTDTLWWFTNKFTDAYVDYAMNKYSAKAFGFDWESFLIELQDETGLKVDPFFWKEPCGIIYALDHHGDEFEIEVAIRPDRTYELTSISRFH